ncbi:MAG TPA: 2-C-methyl-D-erythritol 2,4-cyclodiphosphate synthase [Rectinemataceae bacterium]|nr:2-C-methyl-D-erythritol 2,4-cyclodiphosphate synthase [Rectinemataceae bacterium]
MESEPFLAVVVTAAGRSERFGGGKKELLDLGGRSVLERSLSPFLGHPRLAALAITAPPGREAELRAGLSAETAATLAGKLGPRFMVVQGGAARRDSVRLGLEALAAALSAPDEAAARGAADKAGERAAEGVSLDDCVVLIHDAARPWASGELASRVARAAWERGACVPVLPLVDTPKELGAGRTVTGHPKRASLGAAQTPQGFRFAPMLEAHRSAHRDKLDCTDDAELWAHYVGPVAWTEGEAGNRKITFREDLDGDRRSAALPFRVGQGWDLHRLAAGRRLLLGGIQLPSDQGEDAHSDGDVLLHAIIDALLGAAALGDIGQHFPPSDAAWKDADSRDLLKRSVELVRGAGWEPGNLDCTVVLERPKVGPHRDAIRESLAALLGMPVSAVSVKAKTAEGLGELGAGRAVEASALVTLFPRRPA